MLPRQILPRQFYLITRRCCQHQFLLRPDAATNNAFLYCLIAAAQRCEVDVLLPCAMSNHYHVVIYVRISPMANAETGAWRTPKPVMAIGAERRCLALLDRSCLLPGERITYHGQRALWCG